jgi:precorrin-6B methylase 2|tara:strand:+ start:114 stop:962 length:849 start_codon:yes stop_codon:yes gene_type:complete
MLLLKKYLKKRGIRKRKISFDYISNLNTDLLLDSIKIDKKLVVHIRTIENQADQTITPKLKSKLLNSEVFKKKFNRFLENYRFTYLYDEIIMTNKIIKSKHPFKTYRKYIYFEAYLNSIKAEVEAGKLTKGDKVIFIGSGPLPITLIMLYDKYGIESIGIEIIPKVAELSRKLIRSLQLSDKIEIVTGDHFSIKKTENIKHVIIALAAEPKDEILQWLRPRLSDSTSISYRFTKHQKLKGDIDDLVQNSKRRFKEYDGYKTTKIINPAPPSSNIIAVVKPKK